MKSISRYLLLLLILLLSQLALSNEVSKIPLTIGFVNFLGDEGKAMMSEDMNKLSPLFARSNVSQFPEFARAHVLFMYANLNSEGMFEKAPALSLRKLANAAGAAILVLASPNGDKSLIKAAEGKGPKIARIVLTLDRNGNGFSRFFNELFEKMRQGKSMMMAWVEIAPQHRNAQPTYAPNTILISEPGKIVFPKAREKQSSNTDRQPTHMRGVSEARRKAEEARKKAEAALLRKLERHKSQKNTD